MMKEWFRKNYCLAGAIAAGAILRFFRLDYQSIWLDEIHTMAEADPGFSFAEINNIVMAGEQMPPLYFYIMHILFNIFGHTLFVARAFSAVLGIVAIYAVYLLGKQLANRSTGVIAAWLLAFNFYHVYYSQEGRPYLFFFLFTTLSLYYFVRFLKNPDWKNTVYYGVFSALMLYGHFFGLLGLLAQCIILLYAIIVSDPAERKNLLIKSIVSGAVILILFAPAIPFLLKVSKIEKFWLQAPNDYVFSDMFKTFMGNYELLTILFILLIILYFAGYTKLSPVLNDKTENINAGTKGNSIISNSGSFTFILFITWIVVIITIPLIKSYVSAPVLLDRYFINMLPVIILMAAIGLNTFRDKVVKNVFVAAICIISLVNILFIKSYYSSVSKSQFREATSFVLNNNKQNYPVVTRLNWHMQYFFQNDKVNYRIIPKPIEGYLADIKQDTTQIIPFWHIDGHSKPYNLSPEDQEFLDGHYLLEESYEGFDMYSKLFIPISEASKSIDLKKFGPLNDNNGDKIHYSVEHFTFEGDILNIRGFSFFENTGTETTKTRIILVKDDRATDLGSAKMKRPDVSLYFDNQYNFDDSGFELKRSLKYLSKGTYRIGLYMVDKEKGKEGLILTDKVITR